MGKTASLANIGSIADGSLGFRNRIINGAMVIDQRNAGASVTPTDGQYTIDRWRAGASAASKFSVQRSTAAPAGFTNSMLLSSLSAYSVGTNDNFEMFQYIEGFNAADLAWGTASAQTITVSFWVRSSLTGTFGGAINNSAFNRSYPFSYTISAANTWEQKSVTIAGDTSGTWLTDNGIGLILCICIGAGSGRSGTAGSWAGATYYSATGATSVVGTSGATFYITGVQLEKGSTATSFDYRPYGTELQLCQRYLPYFSTVNGTYFVTGQAYATTNAIFQLAYPVPPRVAATGITATGAFLLLNSSGSGIAATSGPNINGTGLGSLSFTFAVASGLVAGNACVLYASGTAVIYGTGCEL